MQLRLATYNIHACIGTDRRFDPYRIAQVLCELDSNVVALQEVEHHLIGEMDMLDFLAAQTGFRPIAGPTLLRESRDYGNAILTNLPVLVMKRVDLSVAGREPRGALDVTVACDGRTLQLVATHLGLKPKERRHQLKQLLALLEASQADLKVLMGDLNEWFLWGRIHHWLRAHFQASPNHATFPARFPLLGLDHIWVTRPARVLRREVHVSHLARIASDHLPLKVLMEF